MIDFCSICKIYNSIDLKVCFDGQKFGLMDSLPDRLCPLAFHSVYPYLHTLSSGGWFNWVNYDEHVIVNCPSPAGIAMYVKGPKRNGSDYLELEVIQSNEKCYRNYVLRDFVYFQFNKENAIKYRCLEKVFSFVMFRGLEYENLEACISKDLTEFSLMIDGKWVKFNLEVDDCLDKTHGKQT